MVEKRNDYGINVKVDAIDIWNRKEQHDSNLILAYHDVLPAAVKYLIVYSECKNY